MSCIMQYILIKSRFTSVEEMEEKWGILEKKVGGNTVEYGPTTICCITHCAIPHVHAIYRKEGVKSHNSDNSSRCPCFMAWASCERICNFTESKLLHTCKNSIYNIQSRSVTYQTLGQCDKPINCRSKDWKLLKLQYNTKTEQKSLQMFLKSLLVVRCWTQMTQF